MQNPDTMLKIAFAAIIAIALIFIADTIILVQWLIYQVRLRQAEASFDFALDASSGETPIAAPLYTPPAPQDGAIPGFSQEAAALPQPPEAPPFSAPEAPMLEGEALAAASEPIAGEGAPIPIAPPFARVRSPFRETWSLVNPFIALQVVLIGASLAFVPLFLAAGGDFTASQKTLLSRPGLIATIGSLFVQNALFVAVVAYLVRRYKTSLATIGLRAPTARQILLGVGLGMALMFLSTLVETSLMRLLSPQTVAHLREAGKDFDAGAMFGSLRSPWLRLAVLLGGAVAAPIGEEVFFRGLVYNALKARFGIGVGIVVSGLLFALVHIGPLALLIIFPMGMLLAYVYERTKSLWVTITMHALNNGVSFLLLWYAPHLSK